MKWYTASILMRSFSSEELEAPYEENIVLLRTDNEANARERAVYLGRQAEHEYRSISGGDITVRFDTVLTVYEIPDDEIGPDTEVFSRDLRGSEVQSLKTPFKE